MSEREPPGPGDVQLDPPPVEAFGTLETATAGASDAVIASAPDATTPDTNAPDATTSEAPATPHTVDLEADEIAIVPSRTARREEQSFAALLLAGWACACRWALVAAGGALAVAEAITWLGARAGASSASVGTILRAGGILFLWFHGIGVTVSAPRGGFSGPGAAILQSVGATLWVAFLLGTLLVLILLWLGGRRVASTAGGPAWLGALHGTKVALPYAVLCLVVAALERFSLALPGEAGLRSTAVPVSAALGAAFLLPLGIAVIGGFVGGLSWNRGDDANATRLLRGAVWGARSMLAFALGLSFLGLLILALLHPDLASRYTGAMFGKGTWRGIALLGLNLLWLPNMSAWFLFPAMGSCVTANLSYGGSSYSSCLVSYAHVATPAALRGVQSLGPFATNPAQSPPAPSGYVAFVLVPLLAVLLGGWLAARRTGPLTRAGAAGAGALAGVVFGVAMGSLAALASVVLQVHGVPGVGGGGRPIGTASLWVGPAIGSGTLAALAWGVAGGALGGLIAGPERVSPTLGWRSPEADAPSGPGVAEPPGPERPMDPERVQGPESPAPEAPPTA